MKKPKPLPDKLDIYETPELAPKDYSEAWGRPIKTLTAEEAAELERAWIRGEKPMIFGMGATLSATPIEKKRLNRRRAGRKAGRK